MLPNSFMLVKLQLTSPDKPTAEIQFQRGLNVIAGPSDTGKTFILQCIDFVLGGGKEPKDIPEASKYSLIRLIIFVSKIQEEIILERSLLGGDIKLISQNGTSHILKATNIVGREDTVSNYLLEMFDAAGKKLRINKEGVTKALSFRDIAKLIIVNEEAIISETSPILTGQYSSRTSESALFRLLLVGIDDSSIVAQEDPKVAKGRLEGKVEAYEQLLATTFEQISKAGFNGDLIELQNILDGIDQVYNALETELTKEQSTVAAMEEARKKIWTDVKAVDSRLGIVYELHERFILLNHQYQSDINRLNAISEAGFRLGQMQEERCQICGSPAEFHNKEHLKEPLPQEISVACAAEILKIQTLQTDLSKTIESNLLEVIALEEKKLSKESELEAINNILQEQLKTRVQVALQQYRESQIQRDKYRGLLNLFNQASSFDKLIAQLKQMPKVKSNVSTSIEVGADKAELFCKVIESLLRVWHFPNLDRVTFSERDQDIVLSGRKRASHGKGVRAITHAAFNLALLQYCRIYNMPHPGFVLIDSPLVVYREPDSDEGDFSLDVKTAFYRSLAQEFVNDQVIILENDDPPVFEESVNVVNFTKATHGRYGFIPVTPPVVVN